MTQTHFHYELAEIEGEQKRIQKKGQGASKFRLLLKMECSKFATQTTQEFPPKRERSAGQGTSFT